MAFSLSKIAPGGGRDFFRYLLLLLTILLITYFIPKQGKFRYDFELGKPWKHEDLTAPFRFAIDKSEEEINDEKKEIQRTFKPFYQRSPEIAEQQKNQFIAQLSEVMSTEDDLSPERKKYFISRGLQMLSDVYGRGVIELDTAHRNKPGQFILIEITNKVAKDRLLQDYYTESEAKRIVLDRITSDSLINKSWFIRTLQDGIKVNVKYDKTLSTTRLNELLSNISVTRGLVEQGEYIVTRGKILTPDVYQKLVSLKNEYEGKLGKTYLLFIGFLVLVSILFILYSIQLEVFAEETLAETRSIVLILINIILFTGLTSYIVQSGIGNVYLIPYCIIPIVLLAFFGVRIALLTHLLVVLICGLMVPNPFEFVMIQILAGFTAILSMVRIRYISQFFVSALLILMTYCLTSLGFSFLQTTSVKELDWVQFMWFGGNFILTLLAYPLIYVNEKIFGFLSDISLLELSDINNKLQKEMFLRAPGTFQHSLQVANLAEAVIDRIGGNALLARVGSLYHDIGKLQNPEFFIENQKYQSNPHEQLEELQSADIIIGHVTYGVELAQQYRLPKAVIDFIRTHHGTTRVDYFYHSYKGKHPEIGDDDTAFRYPGPKPFSKETAVVMIVDSVEAASRSLKDPDEKQIDVLIDKIIDSKIQDNQFDYATITIHEINTARRVLKKLLKSIYHIRIQYPTEAEGTKKISK